MLYTSRYRTFQLDGHFVYVMKAGLLDVTKLLQDVPQDQFAEFMYHHMMQMVSNESQAASFYEAHPLYCVIVELYFE